MFMEGMVVQVVCSVLIINMFFCVDDDDDSDMDVDDKVPESMQGTSRT